MAIRTVIHLSDLHVGLRGKEGTQTKAIFKRIATHYPGVPVLITGDLTDSATEAQFKEMREYLDDLARSNPVLMVPGNHDYCWKGNILRDHGWENWVKYLGSPLGWGTEPVNWMGVGHEPQGIDGLGVWKHHDCIFFGIDSGDPLDKEISARGYISKTLANALAKSLQEYKGKTRIAFLHHHPFTEGFFTKLKGSESLLTALKDNCEILLFGHDHNYGIWWNERGIPLIVSSHKSTECPSGNCLMITIIDIEYDNNSKLSLRHRVEVI